MEEQSAPQPSSARILRRYGFGPAFTALRKNGKSLVELLHVVADCLFIKKNEWCRHCLCQLIKLFDCHWKVSHNVNMIADFKKKVNYN